MNSWDDYRVILAIFRAKGMSGASHELKQSLSTIFRKLEKIEDRHGEAIFHRGSSGYEPTAYGRVLVATAQRMAEEVLATDQEVSNQGMQPSGTLRVSASEVLAPFFLGRHISEFRKIYGSIEIEIITTRRSPRLSDYEIDVALWPMAPREETMVGRKLSKILWAEYGSAAVEKKEQLIGLLSPSEMEVFGRRPKKNHEMSISSNSLLVNAALVAAGEGKAALPCLLGESWPGLVRISDTFEHEVGELWIVTRRRIHRSPRIRALFDFLINAARSDMALLEGNEL